MLFTPLVSFSSQIVAMDLLSACNPPRLQSTVALLSCEAEALSAPILCQPAAPISVVYGTPTPLASLGTHAGVLLVHSKVVNVTGMISVFSYTMNVCYT